MKRILLLAALLLPFRLSPQLSESFSGADLTSAYPWEGDLEKFEINASGQLQFISPAGEAGSASLRLSFPYQEEMTWEMDVNLNFKSTDANNLRIYVYGAESDSFYIQAGNNSRRVSLYEKEGATSKPCITGRKDLLDEPYAFVSIRLTLEEGKLWTLYTRKAGEKDFYKEGSYKKAAPPASPQALMMLVCRYIKSRVSEFLMDNLKGTHGISEMPPPAPTPEPEPEPEPIESAELELLLVEILDEGELRFFFDKAVDISGAVCEIDEVGQARLSYGQNQSILHIRFPEPLKNGRQYLIRIEGLSDLQGRTIPEQAWSIWYEDGESPPVSPSGEVGQVIINEVMADPKGLTALPETEYVELHNVSEAPVSLNGWAFIYDGKAVVIDALLLPPGGYAVLYRAGRTIHVDEPGQAVGLDKFPAALSNSGKLLQLEDAAGVLIDEFYYPKAKPGVSWERSGEEACLSTDTRGGTPGSPNSSQEKPGKPEEPEEPLEPGDSLPEVEPGEIVFNELLPDPFAGGSEYIELYNRSGRRLSLKGLLLASHKTDGSLGTDYPLSEVSAPMESGGYVLLTKAKEGVAAFYLLASPEVLYEMKLPALANAASSLVLFRKRDGVIIDEIAYASHWHEPSVKNSKGVALERIDPDGRTQDAGNWTSAASTAGYGTPGYRNSQSRTAGDDSPTGVSAPVLREDGLYHIAYQLATPGARVRIRLYDMAGQQIAEPANHILAGMSGEFLWDGKSSAGSRLPTGVYILLAELYNANGQRVEDKKVFLVR
ncbi:MAG: lamin tail domain-containing protein [Tannerellaceae bacterium]|jgi:hypothetical protein|nr:lamin tail domain-containing protein [Tannerellaceae bacterium]